MKQSDQRVPRGGGVPASFGRPAPEQQQQETPAAGVRGGPLRVVVEADLVPDPESLARLGQAIRETIRVAVIAGYADAYTALDADDEQPGGVNGG